MEFSIMVVMSLTVIIAGLLFLGRQWQIADCHRRLYYFADGFLKGCHQMKFYNYLNNDFMIEAGEGVIIATSNCRNSKIVIRLKTLEE